MQRLVLIVYSDRRIVKHSVRISCGHRSNTVQIYKRPCVEQQKAVSDALDVPNIGSTTDDACVKTQVHHAIDNRNVKLPSENNDCWRIVLPSSISTVTVVKEGKEIKVCL